MTSEIMEQLNAQNEALSAVQQLLLKLIEKANEEYRLESEEFIYACHENGLFSYQVEDEIADRLIEKLKESGVPFMAVDNNTKEAHTLFFPEAFTQHVESLAMELAKEYDRLSQVSVAEINDLCYSNKMNGKEMNRYDLTVPDKLYANRLRETLTKQNDLKIVFAMEPNADGTYTFSCTDMDIEKLNRAYFETAWNFAGRFEALNRKQEEYDLQRQQQLEKRLEQEGHYFIVDPELDSKGNPTGKAKELIEVSNDEIKFYKNGQDLTQTISHDRENDEHMDTFQSWIDRQSRPIVVEAAEWPEAPKYIKERNPKIFLEQKDFESFRADQQDMFKTEKKMQRVFREPYNERSVNSLSKYLEVLDQNKSSRINEWLPKAKHIKETLEASKTEIHKITSFDLEDINRVIAISKEEARETVKKSQEITREEKEYGK